ncbi:MAG: DUF4145 domain-containing protein [Candidatus Sericytochromatia bacterium]|nr:DUF4145 domain-containing protein [Candidatus Tanganyikabacteria bacterium]
MDEHSGLASAEYGFDLPDKLRTVVDSYQLAREAYWRSRLKGEDWTPSRQLLKDADAIAKLIHDRARSLQNVGTATDVNQVHSLYIAACERLNREYSDLDEQLREAGLSRAQRDELLSSLTRPNSSGPRQDHPFQVVRESLWIAEAWDAVESIVERAERCIQLERLVRDTLGTRRAPGPCLRYLSLVSRCFVNGLDTECVAMCRAALETALKDAVTDEHRARAQRHRDDPTLSDLICAAFHPSNQLLNGQHALQKAAEQVKLRGNKAVHGYPGIANDVLETIEMLLTLVDALAGLSDSQG